MSHYSHISIAFLPVAPIVPLKTNPPVNAADNSDQPSKTREKVRSIHDEIVNIERPIRPSKQNIWKTIK